MKQDQKRKKTDTENENPIENTGGQKGQKSNRGGQQGSSQGGQRGQGQNDQAGHQTTHTNRPMDVDEEDDETRTDQRKRA